MTVELRPLGVACNLSCSYCYQEPMRLFGNTPVKIELERMLSLAESTGHDFNLFGGEALLTPKKILRQIWKRGYELYAKNGIQTNGTLIDDDHIQMFKEYNVHVGVSIDGPNELNGLRTVRGKEGDGESTLAATHRTIENVRKCVSNGVSVSIIITLHRLNGTGENLDRIISFITWLGKIGVKGGNIHVLEVDKTMPDQQIHVLTQEENTAAFLKLASFFEENQDLTYSPFKDIKKAFANEYHDYEKTVNGKTTFVKDGLVCYFNRCDAMNTQAVYGIEGSGQITNCGRTNKEGIDFSKAGDSGFERYISLYNTPQEYGGCGGCPFFLLCSGGCPGEGADYDLRNKTIHCKTNQAMFSFYEEKAIESGTIPFSKMNSRKDMEDALLNDLANGKNPQLRDLIDRVEKYPVKREAGIFKDLKGEVITVEISE